MSVYQTLDEGSREHVDKIVAGIVFSDPSERAEQEHVLNEVRNNPARYSEAQVLLAHAICERLYAFADYVELMRSDEQVGHA